MNINIKTGLNIITLVITAIFAHIWPDETLGVAVVLVALMVAEISIEMKKRG
jgi:hypothetical protein